MTRRVNFAGFSIEAIAAQYETDSVLADWMAEGDRGLKFPPPEHYFNAAFRAEQEEARLDRMEGVPYETT